MGAARDYSRFEAWGTWQEVGDKAEYKRANPNEVTISIL